MKKNELSKPNTIIPKPVKCIITDGKLNLGPKVQIEAKDSLLPLSKIFQDMIKLQFNFEFIIVKHLQEHPIIRFAINSQANYPNEEGYTLSINKHGIYLEALTEKGIFYGIQTIRHLIIVEEGIIKLPFVKIDDYPRFPYRGFMLDVGRHYHSVETIKKLLDLLALMKMNIFHWHLTEDQGWRIEIKRYPKLYEIGSKRKDTKIGSQISKKYRGRPHEGYYTQEEVKEIIQYAQERYITVIPEIELPGHSSAAIAAYPELSCTGEQIEVKTSGGIFPDIFCAGKESTFEFLQNILDEVLELFPSEIIHIGGDEAPKKRWKLCPDCISRMQKEDLKDVKELQAYFINRIGEYLKSKNRRLMGWNQILCDSLDPSAIAQWWVLGKKQVYKHLRAGREFVMSNISHSYLDYGYFIFPLKNFYNYDPIPKKLEPKFYENVIGVEAPLWTEWVPNLERLGWQIFPRLIATAEVAWTPINRKDYDNFKKRLEKFVKILDSVGLPYAPLDEVDPNNFRRIINLRKWLKKPEI